MTVSLPLSVDGWPFLRIYTKATWSSGTWVQQPMVQPGTYPGRSGFELVRLTRPCLPDYGMCVLRFVYGVINGKLYGPNSNGALQVPDLARQEIRIMASQDNQTFRTIWWGTVEHQLEVDVAPGAALDYATREYHCESGIARLKRWPLTTHGSYIGRQMKRAVGHPGFNTQRWDGHAIGNRESSGAMYDPWGDLAGTILQSPSARVFYHAYPGGGTTWTDHQALETALASARPRGEVVWYFTGQTGLLSGTAAWPVREGETAFEFLTRVCRRQRGRGLVFEDWDEDVNNVQTFNPKLVIRSPFAADVTYTPPGQSPVTLPGATNAGTTVSVDLVGDHRIGQDGAGNFQIGARDAYNYDCVETVGEPIEVLVTLAYNETTPSLEARWSASMASNFAAANFYDRITAQYETVYLLHGLPRAWGGLVGSGLNGAMTRADFRCDDTGLVITPAATDPADTAPESVEVLRDIPLYAEYDYTKATPTSAVTGTTVDNIPPTRRPPMVWWHTGGGTTDRWLNLSQIPNGYYQPAMSVNLQVSDYGITIRNPEDAANGLRAFSDTTAGLNLGAIASYQDLAVTVALRLPHRLRFATYAQGYDAGNARRILRIEHRNHHLWVAHPGAIWDIDSTVSGQNGFGVKRQCANPANGALGTLRNDAVALSQLHQLAWTWYGTERRTARWSLHACGLLPSGTTLDATGNNQQTTFPTLGQLVTTLAASGRTWTLNTPITAIHYDHVSGVTTWITDWSSMDFV